MKSKNLLIGLIIGLLLGFGLGTQLISMLSTDTSQLEQTINTLNGTVTSLRQHNVSQQNQLNEKEDAISSLESQLIERDDQIDSLQIEIQVAEKEEFQRRINDESEFQRQLNNKTAEISGLQTQINEKEGQINLLQEQITDKNDNMSDLENQITTLQQTIENIEGLLELRYKQKSELEQQVNDLESEISRYADLNSTYISLTENHTSLQNAYEELESSAFHYYTVDDKLHIFDVEVDLYYMSYRVRGKIKNVGDTAINEVYILFIIRQADGTLDFSPYDYVELTNIFPGETNEFENSLYISEGELELLLIY